MKKDSTNEYLIGVDFAQVSAKELGTFVKDVLPRLKNDIVQKLMSELDIGFENMNVIEVYREIANKINDFDQDTQIEIVEKIAGKYHASKMEKLLSEFKSEEISSINEVINNLKANDDLSALLKQGVELKFYSNNDRLLINTKVPFELDKVNFLGTSILDKVDEIIKTSSNLKLLTGEPLSTFNKYFRYQVEYGVQ